ncbi:hypothetical protein MtrunA17_Chr2g0316801 [Medicago truncatula]|nr:hypothetical protein MtrunA17_Chr2g0316801 [Medicago truncatula]
MKRTNCFLVSAVLADHKLRCLPQYCQLIVRTWDFLLQQLMRLQPIALSLFSITHITCVSIQICHTLSKLLEEEKARMTNIKDHGTQSKALLQASNQKRNLLSGEVRHLKAVLLEKQNKLKFCELETIKVEAHFDDIKKMLEVDITVKDKTREVETTRIKTVERDTKQISAKTALENAKRALEN